VAGLRIRVRGSKFKFKFNRTAFSQAMQKRLGVAIRQAARAFLRAAVREVPIQTGEARGSLQPLGKFLRVAVPIPGAKPRSGKNAGTGAAQTVGPLIRVTPTSASFTFTTEVFHYFLNDLHQFTYGSDKKQTPWRSFEIGFDAFKREMNVQIARQIPNVFDFLKAGGTTTT